MGPLVPEIFSQEFNYVIALIIGILFGYILEQAGFSTSKKLAGLFYGYDFVVLRVFFTAGVTAMIGVLLLGNLGFLDLSLIYVNPLFLWSALAGGAIMGVGFILGGFCPGTSVAAAAIGKIDAMVFLVGIGLGVMIFGELYPQLEGFYKGFAYGELKANDVLGISAGTFVFLMTLMALFAFIGVGFVENKVNKVLVDKSIPFLKRKSNRYISYAAIYTVVALVLVIMPSRKDNLFGKIQSAGAVEKYNVKLMKPEELAFRIIDEDETLEIIDIRDKSEFDKGSLPGANNIPFNTLFEGQWSSKIRKSRKSFVFIDNDGKNAVKAAALAGLYGSLTVNALDGGINAFNKTLAHIPPKPEKVTDVVEAGKYNFIMTAPEKLKEAAIKIALRKAPVEAPKKKTKGGC